MRILHELNQLEMGGAERVVLGIIKHDKKNSHIVYTYKDGPMRGPLEAAGARVIVNDSKNSEPENVDVDLIHIHTGGGESMIAGSVMGGIPTIETVHSPVVSRVRDAWVTQRVGVSNVVTKMNRKCRTIYNGIDLERLENELTPDAAKERLGIPADSFVVGRLGRLGTDKGVEEFLVACWHIQMQMGDRVHFLISGGEAKNSPGYLGKIKIMAASFPIKNVHFVDETEDVAPVYTAMDCFLYPSKTEGFGLVFCEAMACGVPVVTWKNDLTFELFAGCAMLVAPGIRSLVKGVISFMNSNLLREALADEGQRTVVNYYSAERMSLDYQALYESIPQPAAAPQIAAEEPVAA